MNRRHTRADYLTTIARLRAARPDLAFTSDFIVGFPGETDDDFRATLTLVDEVGYAGAYSFTYSPRPGTPAAEMENRVAEPLKTARLHELQALIARQQRAYNAASSAAPSRCCWKSRVDCLGNWSAAPHICRRCR